MLEIQDLTFRRGEDGNLLAREVTLKLEGNPTVKIRPLTKGKLQEIHLLATSENAEEKLKADSEVILNGLVEPVINLEILKDIKPQMASAISTAILAESLGITQEEVSKQTENYLSELDTELKKN